MAKLLGLRLRDFHLEPHASTRQQRTRDGDCALRVKFLRSTCRSDAPIDLDDITVGCGGRKCHRFG